VKLAELAMKIAQHFRRTLPGSHDCFQEEKGVEHAVAFGNMTLDAYASRLFSADENVVIQHQVGDVLKPNCGLVKFKVVGRRNPLQQH